MFILRPARRQSVTRPKLLAAWEAEVPSACSIPTCRRTIRSVFIEGTHRGGWGVMCPGCHRWSGQGLGEGRGVVYQRRPSDGKFIGTYGEP